MRTNKVVIWSVLAAFGIISLALYVIWPGLRASIVRDLKGEVRAQNVAGDFVSQIGDIFGGFFR